VWLLIGVIGELAGIMPKHIGVTDIGKDALAAVTYTYHVFFPNGLFMIHPGQQNHRTMWHLWTLSVEEHFYLIIPGLTLLCLRRNWIKFLGWSMALGAIAIGVARILRLSQRARDCGARLHPRRSERRGEGRHHQREHRQGALCGP